MQIFRGVWQGVFFEKLIAEKYGYFKENLDFIGLVKMINSLKSRFFLVSN